MFCRIRSHRQPMERLWKHIRVGNLTVDNELNKLAANISIGRDTAGVHWRSDGIEGMNLGEKVAITMLENYKDTYNEVFAGFTIRKFDGTNVSRR